MRSQVKPLCLAHQLLHAGVGNCPPEERWVLATAGMGAAPRHCTSHRSSSKRQLLASQILSTSWEWSLPKSTSWLEKPKTKQNNKKTSLLCLTFSRLLRKGSVFLSVYYELFRFLLHCCHEKIQADVNYSDSVWGLMHSGGVERKMQWGRMWKPDFTWAIASAHCISWQ